MTLNATDLSGSRNSGQGGSSKLTRSLILAAIALGSAPSGFSQSQGPPPFTLKTVGKNVYAAIDNPKGEAGANAGFVIGDDSVLVIDTFETSEAATRLLGEIRKLTNLPVKYVVNTHYHLDHVAGNGVFAAAGAVIFANKNVRTWIHTENLKFFGKDIKPEQRSLVEGFTAPRVVYESQVELYLGARFVVASVLPGHTGGDSVVEVPDAKVTFGGDLFWRDCLPNLIDASTGPWIETLATLQASHPDGVFVPGHGDVGNTADVSTFRTYLSDLRTWVQEGTKRDLDGDPLFELVLPSLKAKYGRWQYFDYFAKKNIADMAKELRGLKQTPKP